ncbi:restriction endonuclease subunit S [Sharpea azabuensis]|uniref:restriction endonuclease subunit S n=1 Tax=Sharpea azabuensis TaxID=322505 RepID=UPI001566DBD8|nr:restriction endonuclease subunit S [Sharpea azabuensis]
MDSKKQVITLGDVASYINGYAFKPDDRGTEGLPIIRIQDLTGSANDLGYYNGEYPKKIEINNGDILISWSGSLGIYTWNNGKALLNQHIFKVEFDKVKIEKSYFVYAVQKKIEEMKTKTHGATMKHIVKKDFESTLIPFPSLKEQKEIATKLDKIRAAIARRKEELKLLDDLIKARFVEMFGDPINNDKGWKTASVESLCTEIYGGGTPSKAHPEYYKDGDIPWVSSKDMKCEVIKDSQIKINQLGVENSTARMVPVNSVIIVIRSGILKHTLPVAINAVPITINQDLKAFIPNELVLAKFLSVQFKMHEKDILSGVRAVTADNIEFNSLKQREMIVPPIELQQQYDVFLSQVDKSRFV